MGTGIDYFIGVASVLMRIGEAFSGGACTMSLSPAPTPSNHLSTEQGFPRQQVERQSHPPEGYLASKGIVASGMDAQMYRHRIKELWGCDPLEAYACTEFGPIAYQAWGERKQGMTFVPDTAYWEFMPEAEYRLWKQQPSHRPQTVLMDEVQLGKYVCGNKPGWWCIHTICDRRPHSRDRIRRCCTGHQVTSNRGGVAS